MAEEKLGLDSLKSEYKKLQNKYDLPSFEELNHDFAIEKIADTETEILTREIRRFIADKVYNYLRFAETLLNPVNAPMFIFSVIKGMSQEDKDQISKIYERLSELDFGLIKLDLEFTEEEDVEFIKNAFESWKDIKRDLTNIIKRTKRENEKKEEQNNSGYFG